MPAPYRKACVHCARAKRRCDLSFPRCYRCKVRSLECQYPTAVPPRDLTSAAVSGHAGRIVSHGEPAASAERDVLNPVDTEYHLADLHMDVSESLAPFPDYELDWADVMENIDRFLVPDQVERNDSPAKSAMAGNIYQERIVYSVKRIKSYPSLFVRRGQTPFIHSSLCRDTLPRAIQDVLGACALYGEKRETNQPLVFGVISAAANRLLNDYPLVGLAAMEQLAAVQALVLYQIIRLFDGDIRQRADAERANPTLQDWTRQLQGRMQRIGDPSSSAESSGPTSPATPLITDSWRNWVFAESLRRTVIVSYTVQGLYSFLKNGWQEEYREFRKLSFHAQEALWVAPSEYYWQSALKEHSSLPVQFHSWDVDIGDAKPSDMDDLGMLVMVLMKGVDYSSQWVGPENLEKFGLVLQDPDLEAM
ncbi:hypothetical protein N7474_008644 [Penicillium riverlandense]|uniref:uncharacterized protein n=1 Tax=Penicillium riverlandense TaxID=1903569 RepID=UPI0025498C7E|nr:uncharacterized protein N7474_008644 [Penicillium riverlandense]KAJ5812343.1 hypothetical protein N7474_008644 [Penicillium riverlandense]